MSAKGRAAEVRFEGRVLQHWKLIEHFKEVFVECSQGRSLNATEVDPRRKLHACDYGAWLLLALFNPVIKSCRALCRASEVPGVRERMGGSGERLTLGSFSEAQHLFDPELWRRVLHTLAPVCVSRGGGPELSPPAWQAVDSTLWKVVPRMGWATWRHQGCQQQALRLQIKLHVGQGLPTEADITPGNVCERRTLRRQLAPGECYLGDAYYSEDYHLLEQINSMGCGLLVRLRSSAVCHVEQNQPLSAADLAAGVVSDSWVRVGYRTRSSTLYRLVVVEPTTGRSTSPVLLLGNHMVGSLSAAEVAALYRQRWEVELFFRWLKCVLPCRHWFAESQEGASLQIYSALICALLLAQKLGRVPRLAEMELLIYHQMGLATDEDLSLLLERYQHQYDLEAARRKRRR